MFFCFPGQVWRSKRRAKELGIKIEEDKLGKELRIKRYKKEQEETSGGRGAFSSRPDNPQ